MRKLQKLFAIPTFGVMISFPNCKINLGLRVLRKRSDGYHDIESVMFPVPIHDVLEVVKLTSGDQHQFTFSGKSIPGDLKDNLLYRAIVTLEQHVSLPPLHIHTHKSIPMGGGLGGGSSNGTYLLKIVNELLDLNLSLTALHNLAASLGSDCPFFIENTPQFASGKGDELKPFSVDLKGKFLLLVNDGTHISTQEAYGGIKPIEAEHNWSSILYRPVHEWKGIVKNDFEKSAFHVHPQLEVLKKEMYTLGAEYASMTGSGSTMFGIFSHEPIIDHIKVNGFAEVVRL